MTEPTLWSALEAAFGAIPPAETILYVQELDLPDWVRRALLGSPVLPSFERGGKPPAGVTFLERHRRSMYLAGPGGIESGVVAVKGAQLGAPGNADVLEEMSCEYPRPDDLWPRSTNEHLIVVEHKVPLALTLAEALRETRLARRVGTAWRERFSPPYRIPMPLLVMRWPDGEVERHLCSLRPVVSRRVAEMAANVARSGLAVVVYFYPGSPLRVSDTAEPRPSTVVVERWMTLFAQFLLCGVLPSGLDSRGLGSCCGPQNATLDGGFVDLDSACPFEELSSPDELAPSLEYSLRSLTRTLALYLGLDDPKQTWDHDAANVYAFVRAAVRRHLEEHRGPWELRDQVLAYFGAADTLWNLAASLQTDLHNAVRNHGEQ